MRRLTSNFSLTSLWFMLQARPCGTQGSVYQMLSRNAMYLKHPGTNKRTHNEVQISDSELLSDRCGYSVQLTAAFIIRICANTRVPTIATQAWDQHRSKTSRRTKHGRGQLLAARRPAILVPQQVNRSSPGRLATPAGLRRAAWRQCLPSPLSGNLRWFVAPKPLQAP